MAVLSSAVECHLIQYMVINSFFTEITHSYHRYWITPDNLLLIRLKNTLQSAVFRLLATSL